MSATRGRGCLLPRWRKLSTTQGEGCLLPRGRGCLLPRGESVSASRGCLPQGCLLPEEGVSATRRGVCLRSWGDVYPSSPLALFTHNVEGAAHKNGDIDATCKQECIPVGCVLPTCSPYLPACTVGGMSATQGRGVCYSGGVCYQGVSATREGGICLWSRGGSGCTPACNGTDTFPVDRQTPRLRVVTNFYTKDCSKCRCFQTMSIVMFWSLVMKK